jgi:organic radical activating enzyme
VVLTGGEPLLQEKELGELMDRLREDGEEWFFEIETNGTKMPGADFLAAVDQMNVSPKLANSGMGAELRLKPEVLSGLAATGKTWFKFVVQGEADIAEILKISGIPLERVILMPEGRTVEELDKVAAWLAERCRDLGFRFSDRLHVRLWGDRRGV